MLFKVALVVMEVTATATLPMGETSTQATSVGMEALPLVTTAMVVMEEMPLVVSLVTTKHHPALLRQLCQLLT